MLFVGQPLYAAVAFAGCYLLGALSALVSAAVLRHPREGHGAADGAGAPELQGAVVHQRADLGARSGLRLPQDRRHDHHGDQRGDVVAQRPPRPPHPEAVALRSNAPRPRPIRQPPRSCWPRPTRRRRGAAAAKLRRASRPPRPARLRAARLRLAAHRRRPHQLLAREVFVSTMSVLLGGSDDPDLADTGVIARIRGATRDDGSLLFTPATSASAWCSSCWRCSARRRWR